MKRKHIPWKLILRREKRQSGDGVALSDGSRVQERPLCRRRMRFQKAVISRRRSTTGNKRPRCFTVRWEKGSWRLTSILSSRFLSSVRWEIEGRLISVIGSRLFSEVRLEEIVSFRSGRFEIAGRLSFGWIEKGLQDGGGGGRRLASDVGHEDEGVSLVSHFFRSEVWGEEWRGLASNLSSRLTSFLSDIWWEEGRQLVSVMSFRLRSVLSKAWSEELASILIFRSRSVLWISLRSKSSFSQRQRSV